MIWYFYTLQNDHHNKSRYHLLPYKNTLLLAVFPKLSFLFLWLLYFITGSMYLPFLHLRPSLTELFPSLWNLALKITFVENLLIEILLLWFLLKYLKTFICFRTLRCQLISFNILLTLCSSYSWCLPCWFSEIS